MFRIRPAEESKLVNVSVLIREDDVDVVKLIDGRVKVDV